MLYLMQPQVYTRVVKIRDLPVMTYTEFLILTVPWIHLSADRSLSNVCDIQESYTPIAETCMQGVEVIWSMSSGLAFHRDMVRMVRTLHVQLPTKG